MRENDRWKSWRSQGHFKTGFVLRSVIISMRLISTIVVVIGGIITPMAIASFSSISASSELGQRLLSEARLLENNDDANANVDITWVANMSLKYQGCYHTQVWNSNANDDQYDIKISTQRLVRFRLCPSDSCRMSDAAGCGAGYGDYVIGMETYLASYLDIVQRDHEYSCAVEASTGDVASCEDDYCKYDTYMAKGMEYCVENNPYEQDGDADYDFQSEMLNKIAEGCKQFKVSNDRQRRRRQQQQQQKQSQQRQLEDEDDDYPDYYMGAYCSENGGSIHVGLFTEDTCSQFADGTGGATTFQTLTGAELPYATSSVIGSECVSCKEPNDDGQNNANDQYDADTVKESCEALYQYSGKCESSLYNAGTVSNPNNNGCNFMQGIKIVRKNGSIVRGAGTQNIVATVFIGLFACSFVLAVGYVYYLRTKLDRARINLSSE